MPYYFCLTVCIRVIRGQSFSSTSSQRADAIVGGVDLACLAFGLAPRLVANGAVGMMLRDQTTPGEVDLRIAGLAGEAEHKVRVVTAPGEPSRINGVADQQAEQRTEQRTEQRVGPQQHDARDGADQCAVPTLQG